MKTLPNRLSLLLLSSLAAAGLNAAPSLRVTRSGANEITIVWDDSGLLEQAARVSGPWEVVNGTVSGWKTTAVSAATFYRLRSAFPLDVTLAGSGAGRVTSRPTGVDCGATCRAWFDEGAAVTLTAVPDAGSRFAGWDTGGANPLVLHLDQAQSVTATFEQIPIPILVNGDFEEGSGVGWVQIPSPLITTAVSLGVTAASGQYVVRLGYEADNRHEAIIGQVITLPNTPPFYLHFSVWIDSDELCDTTSPGCTSTASPSTKMRSSAIRTAPGARNVKCWT